MYILYSSANESIANPNGIAKVAPKGMENEKLIPKGATPLAIRRGMDYHMKMEIL